MCLFGNESLHSVLNSLPCPSGMGRSSGKHPLTVCQLGNWKVGRLIYQLLPLAALTSQLPLLSENRPTIRKANPVSASTRGLVVQNGHNFLHGSPGPCGWPARLPPLRRSSAGLAKQTGERAVEPDRFRSGLGHLAVT